MTIETLAEKHRLKITRDECNDKIIEGRHGHLYVDQGAVCAMWLYARINAQRLAPLGGHQWVGDYALENGRRLRDAKVTGILPDQVKLAIRLTGIKRRRVMSEAQREALTKAQAALPERFRHKGTQP